MFLLNNLLIDFCIFVAMFAIDCLVVVIACMGCTKRIERSGYSGIIQVIIFLISVVVLIILAALTIWPFWGFIYVNCFHYRIACSLGFDAALIFWSIVFGGVSNWWCSHK